MVSQVTQVCSDLASGIACPSLTAHVARLGTRLIHRTTRKQQVTPFGRAYYERCVEILGLVDDAERLALDHLSTPRGHLRITAPAIFSNECLIPAIADYCDRYPEVQLDVVTSDAVSDLMEDGFEAAIRLGTPNTPDLVARPLRPYRLVLCASPSYLKANGTPKKPEDLRSHQCLTYAYPPRSELRAAQPEWLLSLHDAHVSVPVGGRLKIDSAAALRKAVLAGLGIAMLPSILVDADIKDHRLARVLPKYAPPARPLNLLYLRDRRMSPTLRSFIEFVMERFGLDSSRQEASSG